MKVKMLLLNPPSERQSLFIKDIIRAFKIAKRRDGWNMAILSKEGNETYYKTCNGNIFSIQKLPSNDVIFSFEGSRHSFVRLKPFEGYLWWVAQRKEGQNYILSLKTKRAIYDLQTIKYVTTTPIEWDMFPLDWIERLESEAIIHRFQRVERIAEYKNVYV